MSEILCGLPKPRLIGGQLSLAPWAKKSYLKQYNSEQKLGKDKNNNAFLR
jgi:hypothetical protein